MFNHLENCQTVLKVLKWLYHITFPPAPHKRSNFPTSLLALTVIWLFDFNHPRGCKMVSHCGFDLHFSDDQWHWASFPCVYWPFVHVSWRNVYSDHLPIFKQLFGLFLLNKVFIVILAIIILQRAMAPHSSTLAWKIPWTEEPDGLQFMGSQRVGNNGVTSLSLFTFTHWRRKWQPTSCLESPRDRGAWWASVYGVSQRRTRLKWLSSSSSYHYIKICILAALQN